MYDSLSCNYVNTIQQSLAIISCDSVISPKLGADYFCLRGVINDETVPDNKIITEVWKEDSWIRGWTKAEVSWKRKSFGVRGGMSHHIIRFEFGSEVYDAIIKRLSMHLDESKCLISKGLRDFFLGCSGVRVSRYGVVWKLIVVVPCTLAYLRYWIQEIH